jgi:hypothetical protein
MMGTRGDHRHGRASMDRRDCLRCHRAFDSEGVHNRLCGPCRKALEESPPEVVRGRLRGLRKQHGSTS